MLARGLSNVGEHRRALPTNGTLLARRATPFKAVPSVAVRRYGPPLKTLTVAPISSFFVLAVSPGRSIYICVHNRVDRQKFPRLSHTSASTKFSIPSPRSINMSRSSSENKLKPMTGSQVHAAVIGEGRPPADALRAGAHQRNSVAYEPVRIQEHTLIRAPDGSFVQHVTCPLCRVQVCVEQASSHFGSSHAGMFSDAAIKAQVQKYGEYRCQIDGCRQTLIEQPTRDKIWMHIKHVHLAIR
ncbi:hypothetical protein NM688_g6081 [Phlebia brevispora]|uniref:Uncharacterized protein n=1 Tax=Phlebia brevispora TaxID=194682 RepID=A0ACC1SK70_9APHY|nr:hypothetical protein NM688_g6081 [Phlebia brevispora]